MKSDNFIPILMKLHLTGTDCVGHAVRGATDLDPRMIVLLVDWIGAYDHVYTDWTMLPFVRSADRFVTIGSNSPTGRGKQGDPFTPVFFNFAVHNALAEVQTELRAGEFLFAFLDDVCVLSLPERTRKIYDLLADTLQSRAGIRLHTGRHARGIGQQRFRREWLSWVQEAGQERLAVEADFWRKIPCFPDLQCAWQLLVQCAGPRCHHFFEQCLPASPESMQQGTT